MKTATPKHSAIRLLTISAVETYLQTQGWLRTEGANPNVHIYHGPKDLQGKPLIVVLPAHPDLLDATQRLTDVVETLAALEAKTPQQIARKILA